MNFKSFLCSLVVFSMFSANGTAFAYDRNIRHFILSTPSEEISDVALVRSARRKIGKPRPVKGPSKPIKGPSKPRPVKGPKKPIKGPSIPRPVVQRPLKPRPCLIGKNSIVKGLKKVRKVGGGRVGAIVAIATAASVFLGGDAKAESANVSKPDFSKSPRANNVF